MQKYTKQQKAYRGKPQKKSGSDKNHGTRWDSDFDKDALHIPRKYPDKDPKPVEEELEGSGENNRSGEEEEERTSVQVCHPLDDHVPPFPEYLRFTQRRPGYEEKWFQMYTLILDGLLSTAPFDWIESNNPITECISPVFQILGVPDNHRAVHLLLPEDLRRIHHCLWGHANLQVKRGMGLFCLSNMTEETHRRYESLLPTNETSDARPTKTSVK
ncbi:unnamed protein product [Chondrus crispus]|uniref:Uncharacterized protein n=1 Tax=Chondrus crispus TaxID=2769 RepID=R7Q8I6_CHOCR|nr:unnamed protein product [Chondrus crispus]CDF34344.1 unnamed protein product [Chondrus crispus]|eukprot:XP_005714163.1 unnamed protein product [Chondrus crispus]